MSFQTLCFQTSEPKATSEEPDDSGESENPDSNTESTLGQYVTTVVRAPSVAVIGDGGVTPTAARALSFVPEPARVAELQRERSAQFVHSSGPVEWALFPGHPRFLYPIVYLAVVRVDGLV